MEIHPPLTTKELQERLIEEGLNLWIVGPGASGMNMLSFHFAKYGFITRTPSWKHYACHWVEPIYIPGCKAIFVTSDPAVVIGSLTNRKLLRTNICKASKYDPEITHLASIGVLSPSWLNVFYIQLRNWTTKKPPIPVLFLRYDDIMSCWSIICDFIGKPYIPRPEWVTRETYNPIYPRDDIIDLDWQDYLGLQKFYRYHIPEVRQ